MKAIPNTDADIIQAIQTAVSLGDAIRKLGLVPSGGKRLFLKRFIRTHNIDVSHFGEMSKSRCNYAVIYKRKRDPDAPKRVYKKYKDLSPEAKQKKREASLRDYYKTRGPKIKLSRQRAAQGLKYLSDTVHWILVACSKDDRRSGLTGEALTPEMVMQYYIIKLEPENQSEDWSHKGIATGDRVYFKQERPPIDYDGPFPFITYAEEAMAAKDTYPQELYEATMGKLFMWNVKDQCWDRCKAPTIECMGWFAVDFKIYEIETQRNLEKC